MLRTNNDDSLVLARCTFATTRSTDTLKGPPALSKMACFFEARFGLQMNSKKHYQPVCKSLPSKQTICSQQRIVVMSVVIPNCVVFLQYASGFCGLLVVYWRFAGPVSLCLFPMLRIYVVYLWFTRGLLARFHVKFYHILRDFVVYSARHDLNGSVHAVRFPHIKTAPGDPFRGDPLLNIYYYSSSGRPLSISSAALRGTDTESVRSLRGHRGCPHVACCALEPNHSRHLRRIESCMERVLQARYFYNDDDETTTTTTTTPTTTTTTTATTTATTMM